MATAVLNPPVPTTEASIWAPYRMTSEEYFRAIEADVFPRSLRIELWEGQIYEKMAKKLPQSGSQNLVVPTLMRTLPRDWCTWAESPILVDDFTPPLPDVAVVRGNPNFYTSRGSFPKADEIGLVVEIAETSLRKNLTRSLEVYARAQLPCYWVVNLIGKRVEVYSEPRILDGLASYAKAETYEPGKDVPLILDDREVALIPVRGIIPEEGPK